MYKVLFSLVAFLGLALPVFANENDSNFIVGVAISGTPLEVFCVRNRLQADMLAKSLETEILAFKANADAKVLVLNGDKGQGRIFSKELIGAVYIKDLSVEGCSDKKKEPTGKWVLVTTYCNRWCGGHSQWQYVR